MENTTLAFLSNYKFENDSVIRGAILVTDEQTKPVEFRVTAPIKPTNFQKTLYGDILMEHITVELIAIPLLEAIGKKPDLIIVRDPLFLRANEKQNICIVRLFKEDEVRYGQNGEAEQLNSLGGKFEPVLMETSEDKQGLLQDIRRHLTEVFSTRNLLEPFERMQTACQQVHNQKVGE